jgi:hypothetical protein
VLGVFGAAAFAKHALLGDGLTLLVGPDWDGPVPRGRADSPPIKVERLDAISARGLGLMTAGALLARPDGYPVALWNDEEPDAARATARPVGVAPHMYQLL